MAFETADRNLFFTRNDPLDSRLGDLVQVIAAEFSELEKLQLQQNDVTIVGYSDDEGIRLNGGRTGASGGPNAIRQCLYKMTPHPMQSFIGRLIDLGNLRDTTITIKERHDLAQEMASFLLAKGVTTIALGGGHDYAYADGAAFIENCQKRHIRPLVVNFDAHLDVRPLDRGITSGTPFYRLLADFKDFDFAEVAIQPQSASASHINWVHAHGGRVMLHDPFHQPEAFAAQAEKLLGNWLTGAKQPRPLFLSIDIDAFSSAYAMGCSQSFPSGVLPEQFWPFLKLLLDKCQLNSLGIYEVSPPLDWDQRTSWLAAKIIHTCLFGSQFNRKTRHV